MPEEVSITCPDCGMTSYNSNDVREGYCGNCHEFTSGGVFFGDRLRTSPLPKEPRDD